MEIKGQKIRLFIKIISILFLLGAISHWLIIFGILKEKAPPLINWYFHSLAILNPLVAFGLWRRKEWGRFLAITICITQFPAHGYMLWQQILSGGQVETWRFLDLLFCGFFLIFLNLKNAKDLFSRKRRKIADNNSHVHMIELEAMLKLNPELELSSQLSVFGNLEETISLLSPQSLFSQMDEAGISQSVLFAVDAPIIYSSNEYVADLCQRYPERLIGFASVDPNHPNAVEIIEKAIRELGLKGVKFHPPLQNFYPNDKKIFPLYKKISELGVPVVFHVGTTPFGSLVRLDQANPILIDEVACNFPDLRIMLTHLGTLWQNEALMVVEKNPNVYIDTAAYVYEISELLTKNLIERVGREKFIFGTDYPMPFARKMHRMKDFVDCIQGLDIPAQTKEMIFYRNFEKFMQPETKKTIKAGELLNSLQKDGIKSEYSR